MLWPLYIQYSVPVTTAVIMKRVVALQRAVKNCQWAFKENPQDGFVADNWPRTNGRTWSPIRTHSHFPASGGTVDSVRVSFGDISAVHRAVRRKAGDIRLL